MRARRRQQHRRRALLSAGAHHPPEDARGDAAARRIVARSRRYDGCAPDGAAVSGGQSLDTGHSLAGVAHRAQGRRRHDGRLVRSTAPAGISDLRTGAHAAVRPDSMSEPARAPGARLRAERERRGLSLQKAADEMRLDVWVVEALEADQFDRIGPAVYAKGHLRKYAGLLAIPSEEIVAAYDSLHAKSAAPPALTAPVRMPQAPPLVSNDFLAGNRE